VLKGTLSWESPYWLIVSALSVAKCIAIWCSVYYANIKKKGGVIALGILLVSGSVDVCVSMLANVLTGAVAPLSYNLKKEGRFRFFWGDKLVTIGFLRYKNL
jgi:hypothetical protein